MTNTFSGPQQIVYYFRFSDETPKQLAIPNCPTPCTLDRFAESINEILAYDYSTACTLDEKQSPIENEWKARTGPVKNISQSLNHSSDMICVRNIDLWNASLRKINEWISAKWKSNCFKLTWSAVFLKFIPRNRTYCCRRINTRLIGMRANPFTEFYEYLNTQ